MYSTQNKKEKILLFLKIFFPILIYQFANYSASFIDTTMTGQYDTLNLAAVSMATSLWNPFFTFLTGIVSALVQLLDSILVRVKRMKLHQITINLCIYPLVCLSFSFPWYF